MNLSHLARFLSLVLALSLTMLVAQAMPASAASDTYTLSKTFSNPFTCGSTPASPTYPATQSPLPGQCVAVRVSITNSSTSPDVITNLTLSDNLNSYLIGQAGSCFPVVSGSYTCTVTNTTFVFSTNGGAYNLPPGQTGTENFVVQVSPSTPYGAVIPNTPGASASGAAGAFTSAGNPTVYLTVASAPASTLTATKSYTVNGLPTTVAHPNDTVTWYINVTNHSATAVTGVTLTDPLQSGQALLVSGTGTPITSGDFSCSFTSAPNLVCTTASIGAGATAHLAFSTLITGNVPYIANTATVTATGGYTASTGQVVVTVLGTTPPPSTSGQLLLCGTLNGYLAPGATAGSITVNGVTVPIAVGAVVGGYGLTIGTNTCVKFAISSGTATALTATPSTLGSTTGLACGVYTPVNAGVVNVGGVNIAVVGGAVFISLVPGASYCFLLNSSGQTFAAISGIPTSAHLLLHGGYSFHRHWTRAK